MSKHIHTTLYLHTYHIHINNKINNNSKKKRNNNITYRNNKKIVIVQLKDNNYTRPKL